MTKTIKTFQYDINCDNARETNQWLIMTNKTIDCTHATRLWSADDPDGSIALLPVINSSNTTPKL